MLMVEAELSASSRLIMPDETNYFEEKGRVHMKFSPRKQFFILLGKKI